MTKERSRTPEQQHEGTPHDEKERMYHLSIPRGSKVIVKQPNGIDVTVPADRTLLLKGKAQDITTVNCGGVEIPYEDVNEYVLITAVDYFVGYASAAHAARLEQLGQADYKHEFNENSDLETEFGGDPGYTVSGSQLAEMLRNHGFFAQSSDLSDLLAEEVVDWEGVYCGHFDEFVGRVVKEIQYQNPGISHERAETVAESPLIEYAKKVSVDIDRLG